MAPSSSHIKHDLFISFRGADIRRGLLSHLKRALCKEGIDFYVDDRLERGDEISPALLQAIEGSQISLVIFSMDYASSTWCLEELEKVIECKERHKQTVIPVFYNVDPRDVRHQSGTYEGAFNKHEEKFHKFKVQNWRHTLKKSADLAGFHYSPQFEDEADVVEAIVKDVLAKLSTIYPSESLKGLVGIDQHLACLELLLSMDSKEVRILGIWGMPGIGKTTITRAAYDRFSSRYEGGCFLENVKELWKNGLSYLRKKLFLELLGKEDTPLARRMLSRKKVFIVLDDVNNSLHLEELVGEHVCFGAGSRVIVTSRDKLVLLSTRVHRIHEVKELNSLESLELFSLNAFNGSHPKLGYEQLSQKAIFYARGNPLALKILGKFFHSKNSKETWESALEKLKNYPNEDIQNVLQVSYDELHYIEKDMFLDIAFFFRGKDKDRVKWLLEAFEFYPENGMEILQGKALISITGHNIIEMHDLIQEMGWEVVRKESIKYPGRRSRLRDPMEVYDVLKNNQGTDAVEGITLDTSQITDLQINADTFKKMIKLRFLKFYSSRFGDRSYVHVPTDLELFSEKLRYFEWNRYPLEFLPSNFHVGMIAEIHMPKSHVRRLWEGVQDLVNLKILNLAGSKQLMELPDFSKAYHLETVNLYDCVQLRHVHPSILHLQTLVTLRLSRCEELRSLKSEIHLTSLRELYVDGCWNLKEFSLSSEAMQELNLIETNIETLHPSIGRLSKLSFFDVNGRRLRNLPNELSWLRSLYYLRLSNCGHVLDKEKLRILFDGLGWSLRTLCLEDCCNLPELPDNINVLSCLSRLILDGSSVERLPAGIKHLPSLRVLSVRNCRSLESLPELPTSITNLDATGCTSLLTITAFHISFVGFQNVCYPGGRVPEWFPYRTRESNYIVIDPIELVRPSDSLVGFIFGAVLPPLYLRGGEILCRYYLEDCKTDFVKTAYTLLFRHLNSSHVFLWNYKFNSDKVLKEIFQERIGDDDQYCTCYNPKVVTLTFEFLLSPRGKWENMPDFEECGVCPIYASELWHNQHRYIDELDLEPSEFRIGLGSSASTSASATDDQQLLPPTKKLKASIVPPPILGLDLDNNELGEEPTTIAIGVSDHDSLNNNRLQLLKQSKKLNDFIFQPLPTEMCPQNQNEDLTEINLLSSLPNGIDVDVSSHSSDSAAEGTFYDTLLTNLDLQL